MIALPAQPERLSTRNRAAQIRILETRANASYRIPTLEPHASTSYRAATATERSSQPALNPTTALGTEGHSFRANGHAS
jgi:hypothetical protein